VLGVVAMGLAYAVSGSTQLDADAKVLAEGFEAAMLTAGGVVAIAMVFRSSLDAKRHRNE
jgi:hypothetical protein